ncbi:hypothetical protein KC207_10560 [Phycicoccus sp. BSK3Z-2]|uniref:Uncharacterized protein n=1 Tax=Phycicoccus avicenniae TaxID=2828860 RepID=A0A941D8X7_9MICO|nr:hypothetical protein [Phycicoccus avicenniae]MBR7743731.1 hypothetical protein [Phycicoccus avicenniae]
MDDAGSLEFWQPILGPVGFLVAAGLLLLLLLFLAAVAARLVLFVVRVLLRPWWHALLTLGATVALVATDVVTTTTAVLAWVALLGAGLVSWLFLTVTGRGARAGKGSGGSYRPCSYCHGSGWRDGQMCGLCGGRGAEPA